MQQQLVLPVKANEFSVAGTLQARCLSPIQDEAGEDEGFGLETTAEGVLDPGNPG